MRHQTSIRLQGLHSASVPGILALDLQDSDPSKAITGLFPKFSKFSSSGKVEIQLPNLYSNVQQLTSSIFQVPTFCVPPFLFPCLFVLSIM